MIPFFTSEAAMSEAIQGEQPYLRLPARTLFEMTLGETLFLNAKLPTGKEFSPGEIAHLLGEEGSPLSQQTVLEGGHALLLSEVAEPPAQMIDSLTQLFAKYKQVRRAYVASIRERADEQANLLIGIEADGDIDEIIQAAGSVATDTLPGDEPIDICEVVSNGRRVSATFLPRTSRRSMSAAGAVSCAISKAASGLFSAGAHQCAGKSHRFHPGAHKCAPYV